MKLLLLTVVGILLIESVKVMLILMLIEILDDQTDLALGYGILMIIAFALGLKCLSYNLTSTPNEDSIHHQNNAGQTAHEA